MVPAKRDLVNLSEGETPALIGVLDVPIIVVEVVEGGISSPCAVNPDILLSIGFRKHEADDETLTELLEVGEPAPRVESDGFESWLICV